MPSPVWSLPIYPWFMNLTFQVPVQYCSLQHRTLLPLLVPFTTGCCFCFGSIPSFFLELFLHWSPVARWAPTDLGSSSFSVLSFCLSYCSWSVFIPIPKKGNAKECSNYCTIALISHTSKVMLKILQARRQQYMNRELPDVQAGFRKGRGTRDQMPTSTGSSKKQESSRKTSISALLTMPKPLTVWITINCGKFWKRWEYQTTWSASWEICMQVRKQQLELDMEQQTGYK